MTKNIARAELCNKKVYLDGWGRQVREKLIELGIEPEGKIVEWEQYPFAYINGTTADTRWRVDIFKEHHYREVSAEFILGLNVE